MSKLYSAKDFLKTEKIISFSPDDTLSKAIAALSSSHDAAFVIDEKNVLLGAVNPYYAQFSGRFPPETKLKRCMMMPPKLAPTTPLVDILRNMLESKLYFLPVVDNSHKLLGIVSFRRMLKTLLKDESLLEKIQSNLRPRTVQPVTKDLSVAKARAMLKKGKISRLPVVNEHYRLIGLVTRFDLRETLSLPVDSQRFDRIGQKVKYMSYPISDFMEKNVITALDTTPVTEMFEKMRLNGTGSVVLVDVNNVPQGFVAFRDIMKSVIKSLEKISVDLQLKTPDDFAYRSEFEQIIIDDLLKKSNGTTIRFLEGKLSNGKKVDNSDKWYELSIRMETNRGLLTAKQRAHGWRKVLKQTVDKLVAQY